MAISGIPAIPTFPSFTGPVSPTTSVGTDGLAPGTIAPPKGASFSELMASAVEGLQSTQQNAESLATKAATGSLNDIHDYLIASTEASLATQMTVAVRNKAVEAFNEIMRMPI
jgi:flagellar hook-basal body complex protein FliE